jgi:ribosome modulation factor
MSRKIIFGKVTHPGQSYAYHLGYSAAMMGHMRDHDPYTAPSQAQQSADFRRGYDKAREDSDRALNAWIAERGGNEAG